MSNSPHILHASHVRRWACLSRIGVLAAVAGLGGCGPSYRTIAFVPERRVVVVDLVDASDYREFGQDCAQLMVVPGVRNILTGPGLDNLAAPPPGRQEVMTRGVGVVVDMDTSQECRMLPESPQYKSLIEKWRPRSRSIRTVSFGPRCEDLPEGPTRVDGQP